MAHFAEFTSFCMASEDGHIIGILMGSNQVLIVWREDEIPWCLTLTGYDFDEFKAGISQDLVNGDGVVSSDWSLDKLTVIWDANGCRPIEASMVFWEGRDGLKQFKLT